MRKVQVQRSRRLLAVILVAFVLGLAACSSGGNGKSSTATADGSKESIIVASKDLPGAQILSQAYGQTLEAEGYDVHYRDNTGPTETVYPRLEKGRIDLYGEFQGTFLEYLGGQATGNVAQTFASVNHALAGKNVVAVGPASAQDANGFYVTKATADRYHLVNVSDLTAIAPQLVFGGPPDCLDRPLCLGTTSQQLYGLNFKEVKKLDAGGALTNRALDDGTIDVGLLFTLSSVVKPSYVLLKDDKGLQPADNPIALVAKSKAKPPVVKILGTVNAKIDPAAYRQLALKVLNDKQDPATVVADWLHRVGLT